LAVRVTEAELGVPRRRVAAVLEDGAPDQCNRRNHRQAGEYDECSPSHLPSHARLSRSAEPRPHSVISPRWDRDIARVYGLAARKSSRKRGDLGHLSFVRRIAPAVAAAALAAGVLCAPASSGQASRAQLRLMTSSPVMIRGTGFKGGEHVRVVARLPGMAIRRV